MLLIGIFWIFLADSVKKILNFIPYKSLDWEKQ